MADLDITQMTQLAVAPAADDVVYIGDISEAVLDDQNKYIEIEDLFAYMEGGYEGDIVLNTSATLDLTLGAVHLNEAVDMTATSSELNQLDGVSVGGSTAGDIVTIDDTQTLTAKTLTTPTIGDLTNAGHTHADAAGGGQLTSPLINEAVALLATATELNQLDGISVGGAGAGDIATIDGTQILTNKTLTTPTIGDLTNAGHNHSDAANGGVINQTVYLALVDAGVDVIAQEYRGIVVSSKINGLDLTGAIAGVWTKGTGTDMSVQVIRSRAGSEANMLSTAITIGDEWYAADGVIDTANDDIATGDLVIVQCAAIHGTTAAKGLFVTLEFG